MTRQRREVVRPKPDRILDYREFPILYVDDERENLRTFELGFRREFSIFTASCAEEALEIINEKPVAIVLSDQKMPGMPGTEFLSRVAELDPKTVRILVTAFGDASTLEDAINSGSIYRFIPKPWIPEEMRLTVRRGIEVYALDRERDHLVKELTLLNQVSKRINQELELEALLELLVNTVTADFGYDAASILIRDRKTDSLQWRQSSPADSSINRVLAGVEISESAAPEFFRRLKEGKAQVLRAREVLDLERPVREWVTEVSADETFVIPLLGMESLVGSLVVDNRRGGGRFSAEDRTLLEGLGNQAVIAIENARLVDDLRRSREQIMRSDRLGTLGTLAAGLAHEINNPLVSIRTFMSMAPKKREDEDPEFWNEYHSLATEEVERIRRLVETMRQLGRADSKQAPREDVDFEKLVAQVFTLVQREASRKGIQVNVDVQSNLSGFVGVRDQIHQLIMNLALNAIYSTPDDGSVECRVLEDDNGESMIIEVTDTGEGISEDDLERIFDPFFTTKGPDQGTGLGLMICHRIVVDHGGAIEVSSREGVGSVFRVRLPLTGGRGSRGPDD
jgi:signal transduction histidine kinase/ActR/RegA family two-component response regulator